MNKPRIKFVSHTVAPILLIVVFSVAMLLLVDYLMRIGAAIEMEMPSMQETNLRGDQYEND